MTNLESDTLRDLINAARCDLYRLTQRVVDADAKATALANNVESLLERAASMLLAESIRNRR